MEECFRPSLPLPFLTCSLLPRNKGKEQAAARASPGNKKERNVGGRRLSVALCRSFALSPGKKWENVYKMFACSELGAEFGRGRAMLHCTTIKAEDDAMLARIWREGRRRAQRQRKGKVTMKKFPSL